MIQQVGHSTQADVVDSYQIAIVSARSVLDCRSQDAALVADVLESLLSSWLALLRRGPKDQGMSHRREAGALCDALLERAAELKGELYRGVAGGPTNDKVTGDLASVLVFDDRLRNLCSAKGSAAEILVALGVAIPAELIGGGDSCSDDPRRLAKGVHHSALDTTVPAKDDRSQSKEKRVSFKDVPASNPGSPSGSDKHDFQPPRRVKPTSVAPVGGTSSHSAPTGPVANSSGSQELWHAVQVGNGQVIRRLITPGAFSASTTDAAGHSVLYHLIAWGHLGLATYVIQTFPFGSARGADPNEVHQKRGDTLLHLICRSESFSREAAELFSAIVEAASCKDLFLRRNVTGETFLDVAAGRLNFWVVKFIVMSFPLLAKDLVLGPPSELACLMEPPLRILARRIAKPPSPPLLELKQRYPPHLDFSRMLGVDPKIGVVPFADVAFEVTSPQVITPNGRQVLLAHRAVVASRSPVLFEELQKLYLDSYPGHPEMKVCVFRVDRRISKDVWKGILCFMYSGEAHPALLGKTPEIGWLVQLLRACIIYQLPETLLAFTQAKLCPLLPTAQPQEVFEVFSLAGSAVVGASGKVIVDRGADPRLRCAREASAYWLLRCAHEISGGMSPKDLVAALSCALRAVEDAVFRPGGVGDSSSTALNEV